jgi:hypothetical protein
MEYEVDTDNNPYFDQGEGSCAHWEPSKPEGEGWFTLAISNTDNGPICWWARRARVAAILKCMAVSACIWGAIILSVAGVVT